MIYNNMKHGVMYCVLLLKAMHLVKSEGNNTEFKC